MKKENLKRIEGDLLQLQQLYVENHKIIPIHILIDSTFDYNTYCCIKEQLVAEFLSGEKT